MGRTNVVASGGISGLRIYAQLAEPNKKEGIWIKTEKIVDKNGKFTSILKAPFYFESAVAVGTDIYLFGTPIAESTRNAYKYSTTTNKYTKLADIPYDFYDGSVVAIGTDIYLFGGSGNNKYVYKYDTLINAYTKLANIPYAFYYGSVVAIGTDIYLFGGSGNNKYAYKYDTLTNAYTKLANIPYDFYDGSVVAVGTNIYLFGVSESITSNYTYLYDTTTNKYTKLAEVPHASSGNIAILMKDNIYLFNSSFEYPCIYNIRLDEYTITTKKFPTGFQIITTTNIASEIYMFGINGENEPKTYRYEFPIIYPDISRYKLKKIEIVKQRGNYIGLKDVVIIVSGTNNLVKLSDKIEISFDEVIVIDQEGKEIPYSVYIGDGQEWKIAS